MERPLPDPLQRSRADFEGLTALGGQTHTVRGGGGRLIGIESMSFRA
jgi:hypothetical protein